MKLKPDETIENWFLKRKSKDFPNNEDYVDKYKHIKNIIKSKIQEQITLGASLAESKKPEGQRKTMTGHDSRHFDQVVKVVSDLVNTGKDNDLSQYEVFFLLVAIQIHDIGNILGRDNHENTLLEVFNDLFADDYSIDSIEKNIYCSIASAHAGEISGNKDKIRGLLQQSKQHHNGKEIKVRYIASILRFADELADTPERASTYIYNKKLGEEGSEIYHVYAKSLSSTMIKHSEHSININYSLTKSEATKKYTKGSKNEYLLDEIFNRIIKMHNEKLYCQSFFGHYITLEHMNIEISIYSDNHSSKIKSIKLRLIEKGYPDNKNTTIKDICEDPAAIMENETILSGKVLNDLLKKNVKS